MKRTTPNASDRLADRITTHQIDLMRVDAGMRRKIRTLLRAVETDIIRQLMREDPSTVRRPSFRERRLIALAEQTQAIIRSGYRTVASTHARELRELAEIEEEFARTSVNRLFKADVITVGISEAKLRAIASNVLIEGSPSRDWWAGQSKALNDRFTRQVRLGLAQGETLNDIVRRVRGTREGGFKDGIMRASTRDAEALVRTSVSAVGQAARDATYAANDDIVEGVTQVSTLDGRTTEICIALSGSSWKLDGRAFPDSPYQGDNPAFPRHWGERSVLIPRLRSLADALGIVGPRKEGILSRLPEGTRASMDGQVPASTTFDTFLRGKPDAFADKLLGKTKAGLWRMGKLPLEKLIDQSGRPMNLEQLRANVRGVTGKAIEEARAA